VSRTDRDARAGTPTHTLAVRSLRETGPAVDAVVAALAAAGYPLYDRFAVRVALDEALTNSIKHGHRGNARKRVEVRYRVDAAEVRVEVLDQGSGFDPAQVPDPLAPENLERPSGRGLLLMRTFMTWVRHNERGNGVTLCRRRSAA
jgi:serine/threonine-protein kinase RsbW